MRPVRARSHRLPRENYKGTCVTAITTCIKDRKEIFTSDPIFRFFEALLLAELTRFECAAEAYLFMPDHCHLLLRGLTEDSDVLQPVKAFKQKTGFWFSLNQRQIRWQKDFYDHIVRDEKQVEKHIRYILENPVRSGLTIDWQKYPYKGSTLHNLDEWIDW